LNEEQIILVKKTWKMFSGIDKRLIGEIFYGKLFHENSSLRKMFPGDMDGQYRKVIDMLNTIVGRLDHLQELSEDIAAMARRHVSYGVRPGHYKLVGSALMWTLKQGLGNDWTPPVEEAWRACYNDLANTMISASYDQAKS